MVETRQHVEEYISKVKKGMSATSKAFRAKLHLPEYDATRLQLWAKQNCAISDVFVGRGGAVLIGLKDRPRSAASFARTIRTALTAMSIPTSCLKGHWVTLITEEEVLRLCNAQTLDLSPAQHQSGRSDRDSDSKTVVLPVR